MNVQELWKMLDKIILVLLAYLLYGIAAPLGYEHLCEYIYFQGISEDVLPYIQLQRMYRLQNMTHNDLPVYENSGIYFFYHEPLKAFMFGLQLGEYGLLMVTSRSHDIRQYLGLDKTQPYRYLFHQWFYYDPNTWYYSKMGMSVSALTCVENPIDMSPCSSGRLMIDQLITRETSSGYLHVLNQPGRHYYQIMPYYVQNNRPVYKLENRTNSHTIYLRYNNHNKWVITPDLVGNYVNYATIDDTALIPEMITSPIIVSLYSGIKESNAKIKCMGVTEILNTGCSDKPGFCGISGECLTKPDGTEACYCQPGYTGIRCNETQVFCKKLDFEDDPLHGLSSILTGSRLQGGLTTAFCKNGWEPFYFITICKASRTGGGVLVGQKHCSQKAVSTTRTITGIYRTTTKERPTSSSGGQNRNNSKQQDPPWVLPVVITMVIFFQLLSPLVVYFIVDSAVSRQYKKKAGEIEKEINEIDTLFRKHLETGDQAMQQTGTTMSVGEYGKEKVSYQDRLNELSQKQTLLLERSTECIKKQLNGVSVFRIYSMCFNIFILLWIPAIVHCMIIKCGFYSQAYGIAATIGCISIPVLGIFIIVEAIRSREKKYLKSIGDVISIAEYIKKLREATPTIVLTAECYHYETRTRLVSYTDSNGQLQYRTETYQERVVTHSDAEAIPFGYWVDSSKDKLCFFTNFDATKIELDKNFVYGNQKTSEYAVKLENDFQERNGLYDIHLSFNRILSIPGFEKRLLAFNENKRPWYMRESVYWIFTVVLLSWPYRWYFSSRCGKATFSVIKTIYLNQPNEVEGVAKNDISSEQAILRAKEDIDEDQKELERQKIENRKSRDRRSKRANSLFSKNNVTYNINNEVSLDLGNSTVSAS